MQQEWNIIAERWCYLKKEIRIEKSRHGSFTDMEYMKPSYYVEINEYARITKQTRE